MKITKTMTTTKTMTMTRPGIRQPIAPDGKVYNVHCALCTDKDKDNRATKKLVHNDNVRS